MISIAEDVFSFDPCCCSCNLTAFFVSGILVYFFYGYSHSVEGVRPDERSEAQFILSETPDFGEEVEEYPSRPNWTTDHNNLIDWYCNDVTPVIILLFKPFVWKIYPYYNDIIMIHILYWSGTHIQIVEVSNSLHSGLSLAWDGHRTPLVIFSLRLLERTSLSTLKILETSNKDSEQIIVEPSY